jgi:uncharacterized protein (DUF58 family)
MSRSAPDRRPSATGPEDGYDATVRFGADFARRLERLAIRFTAARERREGTGPAGLFGAGEEFVGYRPYRPGEDLRQLDWNLLARLDRPFVRVTRREAGERWAVLLDTSASMGVGRPGKLQRAAEVAAALAAIGARAGARTLVVPASKERGVEVRRIGDLAGLLAMLEGLEATGTTGVVDLCARRRQLEDVSRVFVVGDLCDCEPRQVLALRARRRQLACVQLLATVELTPTSFAGRLGLRKGALEWRDPEDGTRLKVALDETLAASYEAELGLVLEAWGRACALHGVGYGCWDVTAPFERVVEATLSR